VGEGSTLLVVFGLLLGGAVGAVLRRTHYCFMGALADLRLFGSRRRLRSYALALAVALVGSQLAAAATPFAWPQTPYFTAPLYGLGALAGGLAFGFGMVLAGGCLSRALTRAATGSLKAWLVLLLAGASGMLTSALLDVWAPSSPGLLGRLAEVWQQRPGWALALAFALAAVLAGYALRDPALRRFGPELKAALALGLLVAAGFALVGLVSGGGTGERIPATSVNYLRALVALGSGAGGPLFAFMAALLLGTLAGAALAAGPRAIRLEGLAGADLVRHVQGGLLMGIGGALAGGCTLGVALAGAAALAPTAWLATLAMMAGGVWGVAYLERGRLWPPFAARSAPAETDSSAAG